MRMEDRPSIERRNGGEANPGDPPATTENGGEANPGDPSSTTENGGAANPGNPSIEARIIALASRQHGVVGRAQLLAAGVKPTSVDKRLRSKRLLRLHRGVYLLGALVGPLKPPRAEEMAAVLACGPGAVVSHESAAILWGLCPPSVHRGPIHVMVPGRDRGRRPGIRPHRVRAIPPEDRTDLEGVPVTVPVRTLLDLATRAPSRTLEQAMATAARKGLASVQDVTTALERSPRRTGLSRIQQLAGEQDGPAFTRSVAEDRFLALIRKGGLPAPKTNARVEELEVDFLWPTERVVVEVDGFAFHGARRPFENDRRRDARLAALGFRTFRVTWRQLTDEPHVVLVRLAQVLAHSTPPPGV